MLFAAFAMGFGMAAASISSVCGHSPTIQRAIGFLSAGFFLVLTDVAVRKWFDGFGVGQKINPLVPIYISAYVWGFAIIVGGFVLLFL